MPRTAARASLPPAGGTSRLVRTVAAVLAAAWVAAGPAAAEPLPRLVLLEPEIAGDLFAPAQEAAWPGRLARLRADVGEGLAARDLYAVSDPDAAEVEFARQRRRADVFDCIPCATAVARATGSDRVLALRVHRMSQLVLSLQARLRDGATGEVLYVRSLSFRGDNDRSWQRAAAYLVEDMAQIPADWR